MLTLSACESSLVAYHETFWIVVGAAAPVIALANQVTISDSLGMLGLFAARRSSAQGTGRWSNAVKGRRQTYYVYMSGSVSDVRRRRYCS